MHTREEKKGKGVLALTSVIKGEHLTQLWLRVPCLIQNQYKCPSPALKLLYQEGGWETGEFLLKGTKVINS